LREFSHIFPHPPVSPFTGRGKIVSFVNFRYFVPEIHKTNKFPLPKQGEGLGVGGNDVIFAEIT
jgi:hypothetical protein